MAVAACTMLGAGAVLSKGGTAKPPGGGGGGGGGGGVPPPTACPNGQPTGAACILPPAGPILDDFPAAGAPGAVSGNPSNGFSISGHVQSVTETSGCTAGSNAGGTVIVNGVTITIPTNTIVQYPANTLTWTDAVCGINAIAVDNTGGTAKSIYPGVEIRVDGNIVGGTTTSSHVGALVYLSQHSVNSGSGYITNIEYSTGKIFIQGSTIPLLLNDPKGRYGRAQSSPDARFSVDDANPTIKSGATGYPMCVPRATPAGAGGAETDPLCPQINRPKGPTCRNFAAAATNFRIVGADLNTAPINGFCTGFVMKALAGFPGTFNLRASDIAVPGTDPDPRYMAPFEIGDFITWSGTLVQSPGAAASTAVIWVHTIDANVGIYTQPATLPAYIAVGEMGIGTDPQPNAVAAAVVGIEATARIFLEASTTDVASQVDIYLDDKGFGLPAAPNLTGDVALVPKAGSEYFRWLTPDSMTGTFAQQALNVTKGIATPPSLVAQATAFGGGIETQFDGPQPGRARIRANKPPAIDSTLGACTSAVGANTIGGTQACVITNSPTRYVRVVLRSLCAPAASSLTAPTVPHRGTAAVPFTNLDEATLATSPNKGRFWDINGTRPNLPGAGGANFTGAGAGLVPPSDGTCLQSAQYANGLFTGQYMAPVGEFIFPENTLAGFAALPFDFWHLGFLKYGEAGFDGGVSTAPQAPRPW